MAPPPGVGGFVWLNQRTNSTRIVLASRKSDLAKIQAYMVADELKKYWPDLEVEHHFRESLGDINLTDPLWKIPERGVFTEDFVQGLAVGEFDAVVHSWKDLPTENRPGAEVIASLRRADARDIALIRKDLPATAHWKILSSSPRRAHNLAGFFNEYLPVKPGSVEFKSVRGNVPRRIEKLTEGEGDALILAKAALDRLLDPRFAEFQPTRDKLTAWLKNFWILILPLELNPPAAAQGALAIEIRSDRADLKALFAKINVPATFESVMWERRKLSEYGGGCHLKIGLYHGALALGDQVAQLTMERGQSPQGQDFFRRNLTPATRQDLSKLATAHLQKHPSDALFAPKSDDVFLVDDTLLTAQDLRTIKSSNVRVAHRRALTPELLAHLQTRSPQDPWIWASGLESWKKLAALGLWVRGCDEGLGTESGFSQNLEPLLPQSTWVRLSHQDREGHGASDEAVIATYRLTAKLGFQAAWRERLMKAHAFYWKSGALFKLAMAVAPEIRDREHACGPGATRHVLEKELGISLSERLFFSESDWRNWCQSFIDKPNRPPT